MLGSRKSDLPSIMKQSDESVAGFNNLLQNSAPASEKLNATSLLSVRAKSMVVT